MRGFAFLFSLFWLAASAGAHAEQRTDAEIQREVEQRTSATGEITVTVRDGLVTLTGTVPVLAQKLQAATMARRTVGVRDVVDLIVVVPTERRSDDELARLVRESLRKNLNESHSRAITVNVQNGVVTLTGTLPGSYPKQLATSLASLIAGVTEIRNLIVVRPPQPRTDAEILDNLRTAFSRNPLIPAERISISVANGAVTLTGTVDSFVQAERAESVARFTAGVVDVQNRLFVSG